MGSERCDMNRENIKYYIREIITDIITTENRKYK